MNSDEALAPAVESILEAAAERPGGDEPIDVAARSLRDAIERAESDGRVPVIAEIKPTSPTADGTREADPVELAEAMVDGGAAALSVLTEPTHFDGSPEALRRVREAVEVPVLRKDFLCREAQLDVVEADLALLIARFVDDLEGLVAAARERGFQPLVEVHDAAELEAALGAGAELIGVNNRDLGRLEVDLATFESVAPRAPEDVTLIAESGVSTPADVRRMRAAGADALLIGSAIMDHGTCGEVDVAANVQELTGAETERAGETTNDGENA
ncbi:indole-3-glycerol phosphate synthase [Halobiforma nitratireducens]|uniref:Indole-3-glycerol phosphate synthase n=1 Tax=Halobiforma nitratireducens JCM 10879 TaxID=1227454 RepID=M0MBP9_9EURY|nr:indole-3-glycerol phosphate synthase [Halobiforma nitratireducens]EMA41825.1 indole-3-glycerol phosphate synthase [Halobiforma nitratireducens JCM 10879]